MCGSDQAKPSTQVANKPITSGCVGWFGKWQLPPIARSCKRSDKGHLTHSPSLRSPGNSSQLDMYAGSESGNSHPIARSCKRSDEGQGRLRLHTEIPNIYGHVRTVQGKRMRTYRSPTRTWDWSVYTASEQCILGILGGKFPGEDMRRLEPASGGPLEMYVVQHVEDCSSSC